MSLNRAQMAQTASELQANFRAAGLSIDQLAGRTGLSAADVEDVLALDQRLASPADAWIVRDKLETAVREAGGELTPCTVLTEQARAAAAGWFGVRDER